MIFAAWSGLPKQDLYQQGYKRVASQLVQNYIKTKENAGLTFHKISLYFEKLSGAQKLYTARLGGTMANRQQFQQPTQQAYIIEILNQSNSLWNFVTFQLPPENVETLASFVAPVAPGSIVIITWNTNYWFVCAKTGVLKPGVNLV